MFGQHDAGHDNKQEDTLSMPGPEPVDDGTLGVPNPDNDSASAPMMSSSLPTAPVAVSDQPIASSAPSMSAPTTSVGGVSDDLISIKQEALSQLKPLVGHLDQTPAEKFRTTMMMIQAADDQSLIGEAYEAAKVISDEKERAQALLDIVNEINYFTAQKD